MPIKFLRSDITRHSRLGKNRKKLQVWRKPRGRHNKIRLKRVSYPVSPNIGYASEKKNAGKVKGLIPILVHNIADLEPIRKENIIIIARVGAKKRLEILKRATEKKIPIANGGKNAAK